jgi:phosphatidylinositol phospholipase C delta
MQLMTGLGNIEERQHGWEKQYWKGVDVVHDQRLTFDEVEKLCRRLSISISRIFATSSLQPWFY